MEGRFAASPSLFHKFVPAAAPCKGACLTFRFGLPGQVPLQGLGLLLGSVLYLWFPNLVHFPFYAHVYIVRSVLPLLYPYIPLPEKKINL